MDATATVQPAKPGMAVRLGMRFHVIAVEVGDNVHPCNVLNHWGLDVGSRAELLAKIGQSMARERQATASAQLAAGAVS